MKTELIHSYSSASLNALARSESSLSLSASGNLSHENGLTIGNGGTTSRIKSVAEEIGAKCFRKKTIQTKFPIFRWLPQYSRDKLVADLIAGLTVGLTILPQGLAYATVAGLPPQYGLYSGFIGCFVYILIGGTKEITIGPSAIMAIITYTYTVGKPPDYAVTLCFLTGIVTTLMGFLQLGFIVNFISTPVNSGFTSAAALTICSTQIKSLLGLKYKADGFLPIIIGAINDLKNIKYPDALLSLVCCVTLLLLMKLQLLLKCVIGNNKILGKTAWFISTSRNALVIIIVTIIVTSIGDGQPFEVIGQIQAGLPDIQPPPFNIYDQATNKTHSFANILEEEGSAIIVIPLLAIMEHITIAKAFAGENRLDPSQEMISIGISNLVGSFFSSMPVTGSFSRTTVNAMSGVQSPMGGLLTGVMVILALRFLTPFFYYIPKASLASVIVCAVIFMVDITVIKPMWKSKKMEFVPWGLTFLVSLFVGLEFGMMTGFLISVIYLLYYAARPGVKVKRGYTNKMVEFILVELDRSLTFPSVEYIRYVISKSASSWGRNKLPMVIDCIHIQFTDFTAAQGLSDLVTIFNKRDQPIILWKVKHSMIDILNGLDDTEKFIFIQNEVELEQFLDNRPVFEHEAHTPHPQHSTKFSSIPLS